MKMLRYSFLLIMIFSGSANAQVTLLANNEGLQLLGVLGPNKAVFSSARNAKLWVTDGTPSGTFSFTNKVLCPTHGPSAVVNGKLFFPGYSTAEGTELWATDGTDAGTYLVKDINPGPASSSPSDRLVVLNNQVIFSAVHPTYGRELWKSDGTNAGTTLIRDAVPGATGSNQENLFKTTVAGNQAFFIANTAASGEELWRTDGSSAGTYQVKDIRTGSASSTPIIGGVFGNKLLFTANDGLSEREPWISDGTAAGTFMLKDIAAGPMSSSSDNFVVFKNKVLFAAVTLTTGQELWITDGTQAGTQLLKDIEPGMIGSSPVLVNGITTPNKYFFTCFTSDHGFEIWETDGTGAGTKLFKDVEPGPGDAIPILMPSYDNLYANPYYQPLFQGNKFFFSAFTIDKGRELYISDGTPSGTTLVKNLDNNFQDGVAGFSYYISASAVYFCGSDGINQGELFISNGTSVGTQLTGRTNFSAGGFADVKPFVIINGFLLFLGNDGDDSTIPDPDLYRVDGTEIVLPIDLIAFNGQSQAAANLLSWETGNAINFSHFILERSFDGINFEYVTRVAYINQRNEFSYADDKLKEGHSMYFYRLKMVNQDGTSTYSKIVKLIRTSSTQLSLTAYKVSSNQINVGFTLERSDGLIRLTDAAGRTLYVKPVKNQSGQMIITVPAINEHILFVTLQSGDKVLTKKIF